MGGKAFAAEGKLGPLGKNTGRGTLPVDLAVSFSNTLRGQVKGQFLNLPGDPGYDLDLHVLPFSARELYASLGFDFPLVTADPTTFRSVGLDLIAKGDSRKVSIEKARIKVDDTLLNLFLIVNDLDHPKLGYTLDIDRLDLDRYLSPGAEKGKNNEPDNLTPKRQGTNDYNPWRGIALDGAIKVKTLIVGGGSVHDLDVHLSGADGIFEVDPSSFALNQGHAQATVTVDFQSDIPQTNIDIKAQGVQAKPFLHDFLAKDFLSGTFDTDTRLLFSGDNADAIMHSLYADGTVVCKNGALEGIDMVSAKKNFEVAPIGSDPSVLKHRTEFSELKSNFTIRNGLVDSRETTLKSSFANVQVSGTADLVGKRLELKVESKPIVVTTEEQKERKNSSEGSIPYAISGTFTNPKIIIDAKYLSSGELELPKQLNMRSLVDEKLPLPIDSEVKDSVGATLIDPAVVAQHFDLQSIVIPKNQVKKLLKVGSGKMRIHPLQQEDSWH